MTLQQAAEVGLVDDNVLVVAIERDDEIVTPKGRSTVQPDDIRTVLVIDRSTTEILDEVVGNEQME